MSRPSNWAYPALPGEGAPSTTGQQPSYPSYNYGNGPPPAYPPWGGPPPPQYPPPPGAAPQQPQAPPVATAYPPQLNGPGPGPGASALASMGSGSVTLIRLRLNEDFRIDPPIPISAGLISGAANSACSSSTELAGTGQGNSAAGAMRNPIPPIPSLDHEQTLVTETPPVDRAAQFFTKAEPSTLQPANVSQFVDMGFTRPQAALGVVYAQDAKLTDADVPEFASNLSELTGMGYALGVAAGALVIKKNDLRSASELCLALPTY